MARTTTRRVKGGWLPLPACRRPFPSRPEDLPRPTPDNDNSSDIYSDDYIDDADGDARANTTELETAIQVVFQAVRDRDGKATAATNSIIARLLVAVQVRFRAACESGDIKKEVGSTLGTIATSSLTTCNFNLFRLRPVHTTANAPTHSFPARPDRPKPVGTMRRHCLPKQKGEKVKIKVKRATETPSLPPPPQLA